MTGETYLADRLCRKSHIPIRFVSTDRCLFCVEENRARWSAAHPGLHKQRLAEWKAANPNYQRIQTLKGYGLTPADEKQLLVLQDGVCAICKSAEGRTDRKWLSVDHDHSTGVVRGLLCSDCNTGIGALGDTAEDVRRALAYLENPPASQLAGPLVS